MKGESEGGIEGGRKREKKREKKREREREKVKACPYWTSNAHPMDIGWIYTVYIYTLSQSILQSGLDPLRTGSPMTCEHLIMNFVPYICEHSANF